MIDHLTSVCDYLAGPFFWMDMCALNSPFYVGSQYMAEALREIFSALYI